MIGLCGLGRLFVPESHDGPGVVVLKRDLLGRHVKPPVVPRVHRDTRSGLEGVDGGDERHDVELEFYTHLAFVSVISYVKFIVCITGAFLRYSFNSRSISCASSWYGLVERSRARRSRSAIS